MNKFVMTIDQDWANNYLMKYTYDLLEEFNINATIFFTNKEKYIPKNIDIGLHPNFTKEIKYMEETFRELYNFYPNVTTVRSHALFYSEYLREIYYKYDIKKQSNYMMLLHDDIKSLKISKNTVEYPIYFMDMFYLHMHDNIENFSEINNIIKNSKKGLKIFDFHPIHLFLNTPSEKYYKNCKNYYHDISGLKKNINKSQYGVLDFFKDLVTSYDFKTTFQNLN